MKGKLFRTTLGGILPSGRSPPHLAEPHASKVALRLQSPGLDKQGNPSREERIGNVLRVIRHRQHRHANHARHLAPLAGHLRKKRRVDERQVRLRQPGYLLTLGG